MIAYVDASVLLRVALAQPNALPEWSQIQHGVASALVMTESLRTLDRLRLRATLTDAEVAERRGVMLALVGSLELVEVDPIVLDRAAQPMPTELGAGCDSSRHRAPMERHDQGGPGDGHARRIARTRRPGAWPAGRGQSALMRCACRRHLSKEQGEAISRLPPRPPQASHQFP